MAMIKTSYQLLVVSCKKHIVRRWFVTNNSQLTTSNSSSGFTLLYAVLISSILLAIGIAIFDLTVRELRLSSIARESQYAFYAADSGVECALFWDATSTSVFIPGSPASISCGGQVVGSVGGLAYGTPQPFTISLPASNRCAIVTVTKVALNSDPNPPVTTLIESKGYNVSCATVTTDSNAVERALRVSY